MHLGHSPNSWMEFSAYFWSVDFCCWPASQFLLILLSCLLQVWTNQISFVMVLNLLLQIGCCYCCRRGCWWDIFMALSSCWRYSQHFGLVPVLSLLQSGQPWIWLLRLFVGAQYTRKAQHRSPWSSINSAYPPLAQWKNQLDLQAHRSWVTNEAFSYLVEWNH